MEAIRCLQTTNQPPIQSAVGSVYYYHSVRFCYGNRINKISFNGNYSEAWIGKYFMIIFLFSVAVRPH